MTTLAFPSAEFPAKPGITPTITLQVPKDWTPVHGAQFVMGAKRVAKTGTFDPNVIVLIERRPAGFEVTEALTETKAFAATRTQGATSKPFRTEMGGRQFVGCEVSWVDDKVGTVQQLFLFSVVRSGSSIELIQVIGAVGGTRAQASEDYKTITPIMKTLKVT